MTTQVMSSGDPPLDAHAPTAAGRPVRRCPGRPGPGRRIPARAHRRRPCAGRPRHRHAGRLRRRGDADPDVALAGDRARRRVGPARPMALPDGSGDHRPGRRACGRRGPGLGRRTRGRPARSHPGGARLARPVRGRPGAEPAGRGRTGLAALGPAPDAVRALARVPPGHLPRRGARLHPPARRPEPGRQPGGADRLEPALRVRLRHGRPLPAGAAAAPAVAAPAQGGARSSGSPATWSAS